MRPARLLSVFGALVLISVGLSIAGPSSGHSAVIQRQPAGARVTTSASTALAGVTVGIDPGHNGSNYKYPQVMARQIWNGREWEDCDTTGTATDAGYTEATFTFNVAVDLRRDLRREGATVAMTRSNNHGVGPCVNKRAEIINRAHAAVGIDIHADGGPPGGRGFAILEPVRDRENRHVIGLSAAFGDMLLHSVLARTPMPTSTYDGHAGINHRADLAGLNLTQVPKVLIECGNMRNAHDARLLTSGRFQRGLAGAFAAAITHFVEYRRHHGGLGMRLSAS